MFAFFPCSFADNLTPARLQAVDAGSDAGGAETVVNIDDSDVGGAGIEHAEQRGDAAEASAVAYAGGDGDDWNGDKTSYNTG